MDDETGWSLILTDGWGPLVLAAVVERVERATVADRALLVRTVTSPDDAPAAWVERVHRLVLDAIREETGADLEALGSQAAWASYEQTWDRLASRWSGGGRLLALRDEDADEVVQILRDLPVAVAAAAGADTSTIPARPLRVGGVLMIDAEGLFAWIATSDDEGPDGAVRPWVDRLLALARTAQG